MSKMMDQKIQALEERFNVKVQKEMDALEKRLEDRIKKVESQMGTARQRAHSAPGGNGGAEPGFVEVKGWATFGERLEK
eukprot:3113945-Karenia_brevis.AAC.1